MIEYELHPLCTLFPRLKGNEFQCLVNDIKTNGLKSPIIIYDGMILDGGNRYRACVEAGVEPIFVSFCGDSIVSFVLSANLYRRHLSPGQQAAIVASAQDWAQAQTVGKPKSGNVTGLDRVEDRMAQSGASDKTQRMADKVAKADPELAKQVAHGEVSLPEAVKKVSPKKEKAITVITDESEDDQRDQDILELSDTIVSLEDENQRLKDAIATGQLPEEEIQSAAEIIDGLRKQIKTLEATLAAAESTRDTLYTKVRELEGQCKWYQAKLKKIGLAQ